MARPKAQFEIRASDKTKAAFKSVRGNINDTASDMLGLKGAIAGAIGIGGIGAFVTMSAKAAVEVAQFSNAIGMSSQEMQAWSYASETVGIDGEKMADILKDVSDKIGDAFLEGSGGAMDAVNNLGLDIEALSKKSPDKMLLDVAEAMDKLTPSGKTFIFESLGNDLIKLEPLLRDNADGFRELRQEAVDSGAALNDIDTEQLLAANKALVRAGNIAEGIGKRIAVETAPFIKALADEFANAAIENNGFSSQVVSGFEMIMKAVGFAGDVFRGLEAVWKGLGVSFDWFISATLNDLVLLDQAVTTIIDLIPGVEAKPNATLAQWARDASAAFNESSEELKNLLMEDMPSEGIEKFLAKVRIASAENAKEIAADQKKIRDAAAANDSGGGGVSATDKKQLEQQEKAIANQQKFLNSQLSNIDQANKTKEQRQFEAFTSQELMVEESFAREMINEDRKTELLTGIELRRQEAISAIIEDAETKNAELKQKTFDASMSAASQFFGGFAQLAQQGGEKYFKIWKALAKAQAVVDTYASAVAAFKAMASIPYVGPALGAVAAAGAIAAGMARVASINKTSLNSASVQSGGAPSVGGVGGGGVPPVVPVAGGVQQGQAGGGTTYIERPEYVEGGMMTSEVFEWYMDKLQYAIEQKDRIIFTKNSYQGLELAS